MWGLGVCGQAGGYWRTRDADMFTGDESLNPLIL